MTDSLLKALERGEVPVALVEEELERERRATIDECAKIAESGAWAKYADGRRSPTKCVAIAIRALVEEELKGTADMSDDRCDLQKLCQAIVDHTGGDGFWIGEILLDTIKRETGYKYEPAVYQDDAGGEK